MIRLVYLAALSEISYKLIITLLHLHSMPFVSSSIYHKAVNLALREGLDEKLLQVHLKSRSSIEASNYLPIHYLFEVYELADLHLKPAFAIRQGKQMTSDDYGTLGLAWKTCWRARDILIRIARYMVLVTDQGAACMEEYKGATKIVLDRDTTRRGLEIANETAFVMLSRIIREVTGEQIYPTGVLFKHGSQEAPLFCDYFKCSVQFEAQENAIRFNSEDLDIATTKADKHIQRYLMERMEEEKKGILVQTDNLITEIQEMITGSLPSGIPSIIQVANQQKISPRTLKRRLNEKGKTFRELVQSVQQREATKLLKTSRQNISEIAFMTGFSEQSAFHRAFKRWTGQSPTEYRRSF